MMEMFKNCTSFNGDISSWDVSKVTNMSSMFRLLPDKRINRIEKLNNIINKIYIKNEFNKYGI